MAAPPSATVEMLRARNVTARSAVTLGGSDHGSETGTGLLGPLNASALHARADGAYRVAVPRASAAMVTFGR